MNTAYRTWDGGTDADPGTPRWDEGLNADDPAHVAAIAAQHAQQMRLAMLGYESGISTINPALRAKNRARFAPLYYDLHRATLASDPDNAAHHVATAPIARKIAEGRPADLAAAQAICEGLGSPADVAEQYFLWKHSLLPAHVRHWPDAGASMKDAITLGSLTPRSHGHDDLEALDAKLNAVYGDHTRGPWMARVGFAHAHPQGFVRGATAYPSGDMMLGTLPGKDEKTFHDNGKTMVEEMAHSLLQRHLRRERDKYNAWVKDRTAGSADKGGHLSTGSSGMMLPQRGDYAEELAHAMAHGVFDAPGMAPDSRDAPSDESVAFASNLFKEPPKHMPSEFRGFE